MTTNKDLQLPPAAFEAAAGADRNKTNQTNKTNQRISTTSIWKIKNGGQIPPLPLSHTRS